MNFKTQYILDNTPFLKKYLRYHSNYYKSIIRNPNLVNEIIDLMKKEYHLTLPDKLDKIRRNISMMNEFMDVLK